MKISELFQNTAFMESKQPASKLGVITLGERGSFKVDGEPVSYMHWDRFGPKKFFFYATHNGDRERVEIPDDIFISDLPAWVTRIVDDVAQDIDTSGKSRF